MTRSGTRRRGWRRALAASLVLMLAALGTRAAEDGAGVPAARENPASVGAPAAEGTEPTMGGERVTLTLGRAVEIDGGRLTAGLIAIDDQRCPMSLRCRWPGNAWLTVRLRTQGGATEDMTLDTTGPARAARFAGYTLTLEALEPYPQMDAPIPGEAYRALVRVGRD